MYLKSNHISYNVSIDQFTMNTSDPCIVEEKEGEKPMMYVEILFTTYRSQCTVAIAQNDMLTCERMRTQLL